MPALVRLLSALLLFASAFVFAGATTEEIDLRQVAQWSTGFTTRIPSMLVQGDRLYVCHQADGLVIVDVSRPEAPRTLGVFDSPGSATGVAVVGNTAYLGDGGQGLAILDIGDPTQPKQLGRFNGAANGSRLAVRDRQVFLTDGRRGLLILDVTDPSNPVKLGEVATGVGASDVALAGDFAFVANDSKGVSVVDIRNPAAPLLVTNVNLGTQPIATVALAGNTLYASGIRGLLVFDVSVPTAPLLATNLTAVTSFGMAQAAGRVGLTDDTGALRLFSVKAPLEPTLVGQFPVSLPISVAMDARHAFVSSANGRISMLALEAPARPPSAATVYLGIQDASRRIHAGGPGAVHVTGRTTLTTFSTVNPLGPLPTQTNALPGTGPARLKFSGQLGVGAANPPWLWTLDLTNPRMPRLAGALNSDLSLQDLVLDGTRGFGGGFNRLDWLDVANPTQPAFTATLTTAEVYRSLAVLGNHLYAGTQGPASQVFDVSVAPVFTFLTNLPTEGIPGQLIVAGQRLYLLQAKQPALAIYSLADPANPVRIGAYTNGLPYAQAVLHDGFLYGQISRGGFEVLDVSDPKDIRRVGGNALPITSLATEGSALYATTQTDLIAFPLLERRAAFQFLNPRIGNGRVSFEIRGTVGRTVSLERAVTLGDWKPWRSLSLTSDTLTVEDNSTDATAFYRLAAP
jgi:hypothetical protein